MYRKGYILGGLATLLIAYAPEGIGSIVPGGASTHNPGAGGQGGDDDHGHVPLFGEGTNDNDEFDSVLNMFKPTDEDGNIIEDNGDVDDVNLELDEIEEIPAERVQGLQAEITRAIANMTLPADAIPEDFDVNDRAALSKLLSTTVQSAVSQTLGVVFKPVQMALAHQANQMQKMISNEITKSNTSRSAMDIITDLVPEYKNPKYKNLVSTLDAGLKNTHKKPAERAKALRKMLNQMSINDPGESGGRRRSTGSGNESVGAQTRTGTMALDGLFGKMPAPQNQQRK